MSKKKIALRIVTPVLIAGAFAGLAGATNAAAAPAQQSAAKAVAGAAMHLTQGFDIRNVSSHTITLVNIESAGSGDGTPPLGSVLRPGDSIHYEKVFWFGNTPQTKPTFNSDDGRGDGYVFQVELRIDPYLNVPSINMPYSGGKIGDALEVQGLGSNGISFVDKAGSRPINVPAADKQRQADLLNRLCGEGQAACTFRPTASETGPAKVERKASEVNRLDAAYPLTVAESFTFNATTSVEASASMSAKLFGLVNTTLSAKYGQSWSQGQTSTISRTVQVKPGYRLFVEVHQQTTRQFGDFTVHMGNTTWNLTGVYFDIPDMSKSPDVVVGQEKA
jgi:hypothetical protein